MSTELNFTVSGDAAERLTKVAEKLSISVGQLVERALANGVFVVEQTAEPGKKLIIEDAKHVRRIVEPS